MSLPGPVLKVGPNNISAFSDHSFSVPQISRMDFLPVVYIAGMVWLIFYHSLPSFALLLSCAYFAFAIATGDRFSFFLKTAMA
jgi:hypothetical protein